MSIISKFLIKAVRWYQKYLSPDHSDWARAANKPPYCKYTPSCSQYALEALEKRGAFMGTLLSVWRILRCNPWSKGGYDPVDSRKKTCCHNTEKGE